MGDPAAVILTFLLSLSTSTKQNTAAVLLARAFSLNGFFITLHASFQSAENISTTFIYFRYDSFCKIGQGNVFSVTVQIRDTPGLN
jgi:hypothetical protein